MATYGVDWRRTKSNNILEVERVLGIEAARDTIIREMKETMGSHGICIDQRHLMMLSDLMTHSGAVRGNQRYGMYAYKQSVMMLASFERTGETLFEAAYHNQYDKLRGVSEAVIMDGHFRPL